MNETKEIYEILRGEKEPNTKAPAKKKEPAKKAIKKEVLNPFKRDNKLNIIIQLFELENIITKVENMATGETEYLIQFEYSSLYMLTNDFENMILDNIDTIYNHIIEKGLNEILVTLDNIQSTSAQIKGVIEKHGEGAHIETYRNNETLVSLDIIDDTLDSSKILLDTLLIAF